MSDVAEQVYEQAPAINTNEIPVVDISGFAAAATPSANPSRRSGRGVLHRGFLYMSGHGLSQTLIDDTFAQTERFFAQSEEDRRKTLATAEWFRGYVPTKSGGMGTFRTMLELPPTIPTSCAASRCTRRTIGPTTCRASRKS
jgi:isopenicillin N synthase-like dioxygenase